MITFNIKTNELTRLDKITYWAYAKQKYKLTNKEARLLMILLNNEDNTFEDIDYFIYGIHSKIDNKRIRTLAYRLRNKYYLKLISLNSVGYKLEDEIYIDY